MTNQVYFLASAAELAGLNGQDPRAQLPPERVLVLAGVPSPAELSRLTAVLRGDPRGVGSPVASAVAAPGLAGVMRITDQAVLALQGADGDPEMEWEDAVALWRDCLSRGTALSGSGGTFGSDSAVIGRNDDELLTITDELRRLVGAVTVGSPSSPHLYYSPSSAE